MNTSLDQLLRGVLNGTLVPVEVKAAALGGAPTPLQAPVGRLIYVESFQTGQPYCTQPITVQIGDGANYATLTLFNGTGAAINVVSVRFVNATSPVVGDIYTRLWFWNEDQK